MTKKPQSRTVKISPRLYFLASVLLLYLVLCFFIPEPILHALKTSGQILLKIIPILLLVLVVMAIINYFLTPKTIAKYVGKGSGLKGWVLAIGTGILSHGPVYAWYPVLKELKQHGMRTGLVGAFLYNRAIKLPLLPIMIYYFGAPFVGILAVCMILVSVVQGKLIEMLDPSAM